METLERSISRRIMVKTLRPLAEFFGLATPNDARDVDSSALEHLRAVAERAIDAALSDERSLAHAVVGIRGRFNVAWPSDDEVAAMLRRARGELLEIERAIADLRRCSDQPNSDTLRADVIEEIGDAMLALGRLALAVGAVLGRQRDRRGARR
ncbi:MAG TPA: hypothetical protein VM869_23390 [Enhygromyxa sp.]|nr:hypothetical protein [Enhygromyxa sp.]